MPSIKDILDTSKRAIGALRRNPEPVRAFAKIAIASSSEERRQGLDDLGDWLRNKRLLTERAEGLAKAKGFPAQLLQEVPQIHVRLDSVPHLGALRALSKANATRLDYLALTLGALLDLKVAYPSLGLGSSNSGISYCGKSLTGLEVAQTLAIVTNLGHLFGTFSTERALLYALDDDPARLRELKALVPRELRDWSERILDQRQLYRFFYVLAAIEVQRLPCHKAIRDVLLGTLLQFEATPSGQAVAPLTWAFRKARQLAYHRMHSLLGLGTSLEERSHADVFAHLRESEVFGFDPEAPPTYIENVLTALDQLASETVFTHADAARAVLNHLREFRTWWDAHAQRRTPLEFLLAALMTRPADWPVVERAALRHYVRLRLPHDDMNWISEVRTWRNDDGTWQGGTRFLLTPTPSTRGSVGFLVDLYTESKFAAAPRYQAARVLAGKNRAAWGNWQSESARTTWRAVALFAARLLQDALRDDYAVHVQPIPGRDGHSGYAIACESLEPGASKMKSIAAMLADEGRQRELEGLVDLRRQRLPPEEAVWIAFLGRVLLVDRSSRRPVAEIDGLWVDISRTTCTWIAMEHKSGKGRGRVAQLESLSPLFAWPTSEVTQLTLADGSPCTWLTIQELRDTAAELHPGQHNTRLAPTKKLTA